MARAEDTPSPSDLDDLITRTLTRGEWIRVADALATTAALNLIRRGDEETARVLLRLWARVADDEVIPVPEVPS